MIPRFRSGSRALLGAACVALAACSSLLGLDDLEKVDCLDACDSGGTHAPGAGASALGGASTGGASSGSATGGAAGSSQAGSAPAGSGAVIGEAGAGAVEPPIGRCSGSPVADARWQEHWFEHDQLLKLKLLDDCVAVYTDSDVAPPEAARVGDFVSRAWRYNLEHYGPFGDERVFAILHTGKYLGGHAVPYWDASHDFRNVIDGGRSAWPAGDYDMVAHLFSYVVEDNAAHTKRRSPASWIWNEEGFAEIYKYDLYVGLGMQAEADEAFAEFEPVEHEYPVLHSYWFADFYYPIWRDHGGTQVLAKFFDLLEQYYPAPGGVMPDMTWGEYIHFMSGAAGTEVRTQATYAFGWYPEWDTELAQAQADFPDIDY